MATNPRAVAKALLRAQQAPGPTPGPGGFGGTPATIANGISPLVASYNEWSYGAPASAGLPRDFSTFLAGSFGPLQPINPVPVDAPEPGSERPEPRRWQYQVGWNMPIGQPGNEGLKLASFANLRTIADAYSVARACIQVRSQEILALDWDVVPTKEAEKKMRGDHKARRDFDERRAAVRKFWKRPDPNYFGFSSWLNAVLEDILAVDALSLYLHPPRRPGKGILGSNLAALAVLDGTSIRPLVDVQGAKPTPPNPAYQQYLYGVPRSDLMTVLTGEDVEDLGEAKVAEYRGDQLLYLPYISRDWTPYGFPPIERALVPILSGLQRQQYQLSYFDEGSIPGMFISAGSPDASPNQLRELQDALNAMAGDPAWKHRIIVLPGGSKVDPIRPVPLADMFDQVIMTQVCMAFDVMPMELGITPQTSTSQSGGAANQMFRASQDINERKAMRPLLKFLAEIQDTVIQDVIGQADMEWRWEGLEEGEDETALSNRLVVEIGHGLKSIDEGRLEIGHQPWGLPITSDPVYFTGTGVIPVDQPPPPPPGELGAPGQPAGPAPAAGGKPKGNGGDGGSPAKPASPKPKPAPAGGTPAHAGATANANATQRDTKSGSAGAEKKPEATKADAPVDTFAALRELDLIRRRITKGRGIADWQPEHIPTDVFEHLTEHVSDDPTGAVDHARDVIKARGRADRRAHAVAVAEQQITDGLRRTAQALTDGTLSPAAFLDEATTVMRDGILAALQAGAEHALDDTGHTREVTKAGKRPPKRLAHQTGRYQLYAGQATAAYEQAYGLTTMATRPGGWLAKWRANGLDPCDLCDERDGTTYTLDELPGYPGTGGFGPGATVCRGGPRCRCEIVYVHASTTKPTAGAPRAVNATLTDALDRARQAREADLTRARAALADREAYDAFLGDLADRLATQQRAYLEKLLKDLLASENWAANAGAPVTIPVHRPAGGDAGPAGTVTKGKKKRAKKVYSYLAENYPPEVLGWVHDARWEGPTDVDLDEVDMARRPGGARNMDKVKSIAQAVADGKKMDPVVLVATPGDEKYQIADGFHRTLGIKHAGSSTVEAWIGTVTSDDGPWSREMHERKLNKIDNRPGDGRARHLHEYWTRGEGLARWINKPHRWTALYHGLREYIADDDEARRTAAAWFHDTLGYWPGDQRGRNPVGPG